MIKGKSDQIPWISKDEIQKKYMKKTYMNHKLSGNFNGFQRVSATQKKMKRIQ